jgi:hypothetical protein
VNFVFIQESYASEASSNSQQLAGLDEVQISHHETWPDEVVTSMDQILVDEMLTSCSEACDDTDDILISFDQSSVFPTSEAQSQLSMGVNSILKQQELHSNEAELRIERLSSSDDKTCVVSNTQCDERASYAAELANYQGEDLKVAADSMTPADACIECDDKSSHAELTVNLAEYFVSPVVAVNPDTLAITNETANETEMLFDEGLQAGSKHGCESDMPLSNDDITIQFDCGDSQSDVHSVESHGISDNASMSICKLQSDDDGYDPGISPVVLQSINYEQPALPFAYHVLTTGSGSDQRPSSADVSSHSSMSSSAAQNKYFDDASEQVGGLLKVIIIPWLIKT